MRQIYSELLSHFDVLEQVALDDVAFSWMYDRNIASKVYKPSDVFKNFSFLHLLEDNATCICLTTHRFRPFLDPLTKLETSDVCKSSIHVRTMDPKIVQHPQLRSALIMGLNHIPLRPTNFREAIEATMQTYQHLYEILRLQDLGLDFHVTSKYLKQLCLEQLQIAAKTNKFGFRSSGPYLFNIPAVSNELHWLLSHLYISGLDKANNNACFMCIRHIRLQAYQRLMGEDFFPCKFEGKWELPTIVFDTVKEELVSLLPEIPPQFNALPFLMALYKQHKQKYRWLTNAFQTVYTNIATLLTIATVAVLESFKTWAKRTVDGYYNLLRVKTSIFWMVDSILHVTLNLPDQIHDIYVADITRCYESIPLEGQDNLLDSLKIIIYTGFRNAALAHPKAITKLWIKINTNGIASKAI